MPIWLREWASIDRATNSVLEQKKPFTPVVHLVIDFDFDFYPRFDILQNMFTDVALSFFLSYIKSAIPSLSKMHGMSANWSCL